MKSFFSALVFVIISCYQLVGYSQTVDIHSHITMKHFVKDVESADSIKYYVDRKLPLPPKYLKAWEQHGEKSSENGDSHFKNYYQSTFSDLEQGGVSMAIQSISPLEPNVFLNRSWLFRSFVRNQAKSKSHFPAGRFKNFLETSSWEEAYNEFLYMVSQTSKNPKSSYQMLFPKDSTELANFSRLPNTSIGVVSFEGAHILFGDKIHKNREFLRVGLSPEGKEEVRANIDFLKNEASHRTFFITPIHIYWNTLGGYAKAIDKIEERKKLKSITGIRWVGPRVCNCP